MNTNSDRRATLSATTMDGFDDLLSSSSRAFDSNPFANPFAQARSASPDPWSSFSQEQENPFAGASHFDAPVSDITAAPESPLVANEVVLEHPIVVVDELVPQTPLETTLSPRFPQSPGFKESISTDTATTSIYHDAASKHPSPTRETFEPGPTSSEPSSVPPSEEERGTSQVESVASVTSKSPEIVDSSQPPAPPPSSTINPPASSTQADRFSSPLDYPATSTINHLFANLALGGESIGGWQDDAAAFTSTPDPVLSNGLSENKDSEDAKPAEKEFASAVNSSEVRSPSIHAESFSGRLGEIDKKRRSHQFFIHHKSRRPTESGRPASTLYTIYRTYPGACYLQ